MFFLEFSSVAEKEGVIPNRVTFNILMNGCRKINKPEEILKLRTKMDHEKIEINDTTVKFTALAYMMAGKEAQAVSSFSQFEDAVSFHFVFNFFSWVLL
jgi:pentatricopeptide repeat protein